MAIVNLSLQRIVSVFFIILIVPVNAEQSVSLADKTTYERPIVVVIPSYNNAQWYERNLDSVFSQEYDNYRVIYLDDCSTDGTGQFVNQSIHKKNQSDRVTLICNEKRVGALANHYKAVHMCQDHEIILNLDGDDWLKHEHVFERINAEYADPDVWLTYGSYENFPSSRKGECSKQLPKGVIKRHVYREYSFVTSHLRTFYAGLFKRIHLRDLMYNGQFIPAACDMAFMLPMLELAAGKIKYIDEALYVYNQKNPENHFRKRVFLQLKMAHVSRARRKYTPLKRLLIDKQPETLCVDVMIFSNNPVQLHTLLASLDCCVSGLGSIYVLYPAHNGSMFGSYENIRKKFPHVYFHYINNLDDFKPILMQLLENTQQEYIMFARDSCVVKGIVDLSNCVQLLNKTRAYGFFLSLGKNITRNNYLTRYQKQPPMLELVPDIFTWQFKHGEFDWAMVHNSMNDPGSLQ